MADQQSGSEQRRVEPVIGAGIPPGADEDRAYGRMGPARRSKWPVIAGVLVLAALVAGGLYWYLGQPAAPPAPPAIVPPPVAPVKAEPAIRHPIEATPSEAPLPTLGNSDVVVFDALAALVGRDTAGRFLVLPGIIRRVVVAVDNLPRERLAQRLSPVKPVPGQFAVSGGMDHKVMAAANAARYTPYVHALDAVDAAKLHAVYVRFYPLFQEAYRELGYPKGYFNDRLVEVLDLMIATPEHDAPIALVQEKVMYQFADPKLEALPVGQKMLLRMGTENARKVKAKLREIRGLVAASK